MEGIHLSLSVHQLVDPLLRVGDIDDRVYNQETMRMGSLLHAAFQRRQGKEYLSEVALEGEFTSSKGTIELSGRADGIILGGDCPVLDEIKSTVMDLQQFHKQQKAWHLGQALCYAAMYLRRISGSKIIVRLTYLLQGGEDRLVKEFPFSREEAEKAVEGYVEDYLTMLEERLLHEETRDRSALKLPFPYKAFRPGQREVAKYVYGAIGKKKSFLLEAPTGIGKTMSVLFPAIRCLKKGSVDKVFYLTAKSTGAIAAEKAIGELMDKGWEGRDSRLLSRDKICLSKGHGCNPDECPYARDYYTKLRFVIKEICNNEKRFDPETVLMYAKAAGICPFELQLDLSESADVIIADYNYLIDPIVKLERYFGEGVDSKPYVGLLDEAHNLVERGRGCYSIDFSLDELLEAKKSLKGKEFAALRKALGKAIAAIEDHLPLEENSTKVLEAPPSEIQAAFESLRKSETRHKKAKKPHPPEKYGEISRKMARYSRLVDEYYCSSYRVYASRKGKDASYHLLCVDPSPFLRESFSRLRSCTLFSATLTPISYYMKAIVGQEEWPFLLLPSPFPKDNFKVILAPNVSVRYKDRAKSYPEVAAYLKNFVEAKQGNYFLFFPSYEYLESILPHLRFDNANLFPQTRSMLQEEKDLFLSHFPPSPTSTNVGLLILGGSFSEGVDLVDDRLIGVAVVGIGLPQISEQNEIIRSYASSIGLDGFDYAYKDPGMNKVMQALGRVIRSFTDVGASLLLDDRYAQSRYRQEFLRKYGEYEIALSPNEVTSALATFHKTK